MHSWKVPAVPFLALLRPGKDVVLAGEEDKELFKSTGRTVCSGGTIWHMEGVQEISVK